MARHLYIGNDVAVSYNASTGALASGALDIQKLSASGPTSMVAGDTIADSAQFRIVQGNGTTNIVSPWKISCSTNSASRYCDICRR